MVRGLDIFRRHFADFTDRYVLIGGVAATLAMEEVGLNFRATKDLDLVLIVEALDVRFAEQSMRCGYPGYLAVCTSAWSTHPVQDLRLNVNSALLRNPT